MDSFEYDIEIGDFNMHIIINEIEQITKDFPKPNNGKKWSDEDIRLVLSYVPTRWNAILLAQTLGRGVGSILWIWKAASMSARAISQRKYGWAGYFKQVKRVAKEVGWMI